MDKAWGSMAPGSEYSRRFGEPRPAELTTPVVAEFTISVVTWAGVRLGLWLNMRAATPATWGEAIEVPFRLASAVGEVCQAEVIALPGAKRSRQVPMFE
jgi:hypothetical protein